MIGIAAARPAKTPMSNSKPPKNNKGGNNKPIPPKTKPIKNMIAAVITNVSDLAWALRIDAIFSPYN